MVVRARSDGLRGHFVFDRIRRHRRFAKVVTYSARNHVHEFRLTAPVEVDAEFRRWIALAYAVGEQRHLRSAVVPRRLRLADPGRKRARPPGPSEIEEG